MSFVLNRLKEASTWRGLVWLLTVFGVRLLPEQTEAIVLAGMALAGLLGVFLPDDSKPELPPVDLVATAGGVRESVPAEFDSKIDGHGFGDK